MAHFKAGLRDRPVVLEGNVPCFLGFRGGGRSPKSQFTLPLSAHGPLEALNRWENVDNVACTPSLCLSEGASRIFLQALQTACLASPKLNPQNPH